MKDTSKTARPGGRLAGAALALLALGGCAAPVPEPAPLHVPPQSWTHADGAGAPAVSPQWWRTFGSAELDALVQLAQAQSLDIAAAMARVRQAEAAMRQAGAALLPSLDGQAYAQRANRGQDGGSAGQYGAALTASYEVDFWGRNRAVGDAATAAWQASRFERDTVRLTVTAQVAHGWLQAVALRERARIARLNLADAERLLALVQARVRAGAASPLELAQQRTQAASQRQAVAALQRQREDAEVALALLLGQARRVEPRTPSLQALQLPEAEPGLPAQLLERRPDIAEAEAQLAAARADVRAARAALWPRLTLTASASASADRAADWLRAPVYSLLAGLAGPIFDGGRLSARLDGAQARREELLAGYHKAIVAAFGDVELALNAALRLGEQAAAQDEVLVQAQNALALAESRYRSGADTLLVLLDAQRTVAAAQDLAVQIRLARMQAAVSLYRALGGGWQAPQGAPEPAATQAPGVRELREESTS